MHMKPKKQLFYVLKYNCVYKIVFIWGFNLTLA